MDQKNSEYADTFHVAHLYGSDYQEFKFHHYRIKLSNSMKSLLKFLGVFNVEHVLMDGMTVKTVTQ